MDAPLLLALARAKFRAGCNGVEKVMVGRHFLALSWVPDMFRGGPPARDARDVPPGPISIQQECFAKHGWAWVLLLAPQPELWLLHDKDEAFLFLKQHSLPDQTRRWGLELKGAHLEAVEGDPRERWLGLRFQRRALTGRMEQTRLSFQAIPGRGGLRLDGTDVLTQVRFGMGSPFPADAPTPVDDPPPLKRWFERWGEQSEAALHGDVFEILPGEGNLLARHYAWSLERAAKLLLDPRKAAMERKLREEQVRLERYGDALAQDRARHESQLALRGKAGAISAELYRLKGITQRAELLDGTIIELPAGLQIEDAAQKWFTAAKRAERGLARVAHLEKDRQRQLEELEKRTAEGAERKVESAEKSKRQDNIRKGSKKESKGRTGMDKGSKGAEKRSDGKGRAFRSVMVDGFEVLIGKGDADNDALTFKVADKLDLWLHVASMPGSHVIIRNPDKLSELPRGVIERAAQLAAFHSKARESGKVEVHWCRVADVSKPRGFEPGKVILKTYKSVRVYPKE